MAEVWAAERADVWVMAWAEVWATERAEAWVEAWAGGSGAVLVAELAST